MMKTLNRVIYILTAADILLVAAFGFIMPFFAIFITEQIPGAGVATVGFFTAIYWISKSVFQLPIAWFLDKTEGEFDELHALIFGYLLSSLVAFGYIFADQVWHIYTLATIIGFGDALGVPPFLAIFSRHLDRARANTQWTLHSVGVGLASAASGALAGILVQKFGFNSVFILGGVLSFVAALSLLFLKPYLRTTNGKLVIPPTHKTKPHQKSVL